MCLAAVGTAMPMPLPRPPPTAAGKQAQRPALATDMAAATAPAAVATPARRGGRRGHSYAAVHSMRHAPRIVGNAMQLPATTRAFHHGGPDTAEAVPYSQRQAQEHSCAL